MTVSMHKISVPIFVQFLASLSAALEKTAAHCEAITVEPSALRGCFATCFRLFARCARRRTTPSTPRRASPEQNHRNSAIRSELYGTQCGMELGKRDFMGTPVSL